jgi:osmotically-inducible protein OsmY
MSRFVSVFLLSFGIAFASPQAKDQTKGAGAHDVEGHMSETGCLSKNDDSFEFTNSETGETVTLNGSADLAKHVGHTVMVTGSRNQKGTQEFLQVETIKHVAASCAEPGEADARTGADSSTRRDPKRVTADQQGNSERDQHITQQIRKAVVADESLSTDAHNVKIITRDGKVTLRGPVETEAEKKAIEAMAKTVAGDGLVKNEITLANETKRKTPQSK